MSESIELNDPLFRLIARFSNGEMIQHIVKDPMDAHSITPETRYAVITSLSCQDPSQCTDITVISLRDLSFIKTERVTLENLTAERRMAGIRSTGPSPSDDRMPKTISTLKFI